jgi:hypothetical protein
MEVTRTMSTAESEVRLSEQELVARWRAEELKRAGYPDGLAESIAARADIDLHRALDLLGEGCPAELAAAILL